MFLCLETPAMFESENIQGYIQSQICSESKQWIYEILDGKRESTCVTYRDPGGRFLLLPNIQDSVTHGRGYIAIVSDRKLRCLRDLRAHHVGLLEEIKTKSIGVLNSFGCRWKCSIHYHPSVYQLHLHFRQYDEKYVPRVFPIEEVIGNLVKNGDFYKTENIIFSVSTGSDIFKYGKKCFLGYWPKSVTPHQKIMEGCSLITWHATTEKKKKNRLVEWVKIEPGVGTSVKNDPPERDDMHTICCPSFCEKEESTNRWRGRAFSDIVRRGVCTAKRIQLS